MVYDYRNTWCFSLKLVSAIFYQIFIVHQMIALQKLWKKIFISSKKLFSFLRYSNFCIFIFPYFFPVSHCFRGWFKKNLKVCDVITCLNKDLITHFVWYFEKQSWLIAISSLGHFTSLIWDKLKVEMTHLHHHPM